MFNEATADSEDDLAESRPAPEACALPDLASNAARANSHLVPELIAVSLGHFAVDLCSGIWPAYKTLASLELTRAGFLATLGSVIGNGLQPLFGVVVDRGWRKLMLMLGVLMSGAIVFVPYCSNYTGLFVLVLITSVGSAAFHPTGAGTASSISQGRTGLLLAVFLMGGYIGYALSQVAFTATYRALGGSTGVLFVVPCLACVGVWRLVQPAPLVAHSDSGARVSFVTIIGQLRNLCVIQFLSSATNMAVIFLMPELLLSRGSPSWLVNGIGHSALVLGGALSLFPAGHAADRFSARKVFVVANLLSGVFLLVLLYGPSAPGFEIAAAVGLGMFNGANNVVAVSEGNRVFPGRAGAISALLMGLPWCFSSLTPWLAGVLADPMRGGSPVKALAWIGLSIPLALLLGTRVPDRKDADR